MSEVAIELAQQLGTYVATLIKEEAQYAVQYPNQFKELEEQMILMQSFIADASRKKDDRKTVNATIAALRELIYQADDLVVDCHIREDYQKKKGRPCFLSPSEICFRLQTGKKLAQINSEIERKIGKVLNVYNAITGKRGTEDNLGASQKRFSADVYEQSEIVGLEIDAKTIKDWISNSSSDQKEKKLRVGIVGMGGLGKTTLAKKLYHDPYLTKRYEVKIWVSVSQRADRDEIMDSMLIQLGKQKNEVGSSSGDKLSTIKKTLLEKSYLLVLDDVWSTDGWWTSISEGLPDPPKEDRNCIIITSRDGNVLQSMGVLGERVLKPRKLTDGETWELFCKVVPIDSTEQSLGEIGKRIVKKCKYLPLAIKTIGGILSRNHEKSVAEWTTFEEKFHAKLTETSNIDPKGDEDSVIASLQLSYDELPACLKPCLLCFSIYPEDKEIDVDQLIHWWVAEGFVRCKNGETASEMARNYLSELICRCLVEVAEKTSFNRSVITCKVHDMVRDLTIKVAREEEFCSFDEASNQMITKSTSRRLGVGRDTKFQNLRGNSKLRALLLTATDQIGFSKDIELAKVHSLRVLDLSKVKLNLTYIKMKDFWEWITSLKRLACLNLREVVKLCEVPNSIGKLWGLQVLILEECKSLNKLPSSIVKLPRLIVLNVGSCPMLKCLPQGFSRLSNLQELYGFKIGGPVNSTGSRSGSSSTLGELENLTELRLLQIDITEESTIQEHELQALAKLEKLKMLSINAGDKRSENNDILKQLGKLSPPPSVEELYLKNYLGETIPEWISPKKLKKLQYFCMEHSRVENVSEDFLGKAEFKWDHIIAVCLKFCQRLVLTKEQLTDAMPEIKYIEISQCSLMKGFRFDVTAMGFWRKGDDDKKDSKLPGDDI